jgi:hypothetical protein
MAIVARLLRGEPLDLVARQMNVSVARLTEWRDRALAGASEHDNFSMRHKLGRRFKKQHR